MDNRSDQPAGFAWIGAFFLFGATMAGYAAFTLLKPGTVLDALWALNKRGHVALLAVGRTAGLLFIVLSAALMLTVVGWFRRRKWGWALGVAVVAMNMVGDLVNLIHGEGLKGAAGLVIAGALLIYMTRPGMRSYFPP